MQNFSTKLTCTQWQQAAKLIRTMAKYTFANITYENYAHVFNIQSLYKKIIVRMLSKVIDRYKIKISITANEIMSLRYLCSDNRDILDNLRYEDTIFTEISSQINVQEQNFFTLHHCSINNIIQ